MNAGNLLSIFNQMRSLGLVASKRDFSRAWLEKGQSYLADLVGHNRLGATVPSAVIDRLRDRLAAVAGRVPAVAASEIMTLIEGIDRALKGRQLPAR